MGGNIVFVKKNILIIKLAVPIFIETMSKYKTEIYFLITNNCREDLNVSGVLMDLNIARAKVNN